MNEKEKSKGEVVLVRSSGQWVLGYRDERVDAQLATMAGGYSPADKQMACGRTYQITNAWMFSVNTQSIPTERGMLEQTAYRLTSLVPGKAVGSDLEVVPEIIVSLTADDRSIFEKLIDATEDGMAKSKAAQSGLSLARTLPKHDPSFVEGVLSGKIDPKRG